MCESCWASVWLGLKSRGSMSLCLMFGLSCKWSVAQFLSIGMRTISGLLLSAANSEAKVKVSEENGRIKEVNVMLSFSNE